MLIEKIHRKPNCDQIRKLFGEHGIQFNPFHFKQIFIECLLGRMKLTASVIELLQTNILIYTVEPHVQVCMLVLKTHC